MTEMTKSMAVFTGSVNPSLADQVATELGTTLGNVKLEKFANGEIYARYLDSVRGADVFIIQSIAGEHINDALMEMLIMIDAAKRASARTISAVVTHYGYSRQERKAAPREPITAKLRRAGVTVEEFDDAVRVSRTGDILPLKINTMPHPGFPTDMQPLMGVLLSVAKGTSTITESVWDNRFRYVDELRKMGASVQVDGQVAVFEGVEKLSPAPLRASDLRAGAAMVVAALMADGTSEIEEIGHIERGYENIVEKLRGLGAEISKVERMPAALEQAL